MKQNRTHSLFHLSGLLGASLFALVAIPALGTDQAGVYDFHSASTTPVYSYALTKSKEGGVESWRAVFKDAEKKDFAVENTVLKDGKLVRYALTQPQLAEEADVKVGDAGITFRYLSNGKWKEDFEATQGNIIAGPQIVDIVQRSWDSLLAGNTVRVRLVVPDRLETVGFRFTAEKSADTSLQAFHFAPSNFLIRALVGKITLKFDSKTRQPISIEGRTFLKRKKGNDWEELTASIRFDRP